MDYFTTISAGIGVLIYIIVGFVVFFSVVDGFANDKGVPAPGWMLFVLFLPITLPLVIGFLCAYGIHLLYRYISGRTDDNS